MCKTYDCMGIGLAILVRSLRLKLLSTDCITGALWQLLLQLFLHFLLVHGETRKALATHRSPIEHTWDDLFHNFQFLVFPVYTFALESGMVGPRNCAKDERSPGTVASGEGQILQKV